MVSFEKNYNTEEINQVEKRFIIKGQIASDQTKDALFTTIYTVVGIYATFLSSIFIINNFESLTESQASLGGLYTNLIGIIAVAHAKFNREIFVHRKIYWLSFFAYFIILTIFAQANCMVNPQNFQLISEKLKSPYISIFLQLTFIGTIYALANQKKWAFQIKYNKRKL